METKHGIDQRPRFLIWLCFVGILASATFCLGLYAAWKASSGGTLFVVLLGMVLCSFLILGLFTLRCGSCLLKQLALGLEFAEAVKNGRFQLNASLGEACARDSRGFGLQVKDALNSSADIFRNITSAASTIEHFSSDFTQQSGILSSGVQNSTKRIQAMDEAARKMSEHLTVMAQDTSSASTSLQSVAAATDELNASIGEIATNMNQTSVMVEQAAEAAEKAASDVTHLGDVASDGAKGFKEVLGSIQAIRTQSEAPKNDMDAMGGRMRQIGQIMDVISDIADQTNLLALNAAIEAARAGEAGRGFAVVADEVRKLAEKTMNATKDVEITISGIQAMAKRNIEATDAAVEAIAASTAVAQEHIERIQGVENTARKTTGDINTLADIINQAKKLMASVASATEQQSIATDDIALNLNEASAGIASTPERVTSASNLAKEIAEDMSEIKANLSSLAASTLQVNSGAQELSKLSMSLFGTLKRFDLGKPPFDVGKVKTMHLAWRSRLESVIGGHLSLRPEEVASHHECSFGKWYDGEGSRLLGKLPEFQEVGRYHEQIHALARKIVAQAQEGQDAGDIQSSMREFEKARVSLFQKLDDLYRKSFS